MTLSFSEAKLELAVLESKAKDIQWVDVVTHMSNSGLPPEIVLRLEDLWTQTKIIAGKVVHVGKIILKHIIEFIEKNRHLAIRTVIGAAIGALVNLVPFLGPLLAPLSTLLGAAIGAASGLRMDQGRPDSGGIVESIQDLISVAEKFLRFLADIFIALKDEFVKGKAA